MAGPPPVDCERRDADQLANLKCIDQPVRIAPDPLGIIEIDGRDQPVRTVAGLVEQFRRAGSKPTVKQDLAASADPFY
jgi:hypothetical protein